MLHKGLVACRDTACGVLVLFMVELKDFISKSICDIVEGIYDADKKIKEQGAFIAKTINGPIGDADYATGQDADGNVGLVKNVEFDITVIAEDENKSGGGVSLIVPTSIGFNFGVLSKNRKRNEQHIKFSVPLSLPHK